MGTYHCGSAAASKVAPIGRGNLHIDTWNAKDPLSQRHLKTKKILFAGDLQPPTSPRVPFTFFDDVQPPKKKKIPPSVLPLQPKSPLFYVIGSYVTSLSNVLQSSGPDISSPHSKIASSTRIFTAA
ncbi:hypothetical protein AVEN_141644-1 [Araneus ventricosus]|uniref:Uncharacterized protein n=1 Tax=Araneus ventricosus TaxID=182803 RepID=A0A4Y2LLJ4_ARAVE|nr:hypothetical protein AVEN_141644-1 [Araneus ventricosus]